MKVCISKQTSMKDHIFSDVIILDHCDLIYGWLADRMVSQKRGVERILLLAMKLVILVGTFLTFWYPNIWLRCRWN